MSWLDIALIIVLAFCTLLGLRTGVIRTVFTVVGIYLGISLAGNYYTSLSGQLAPQISDPDQAKIASFAIILIMVVVVAFIAASVVRRVLSMLILGWVDMVGGGIFGFATGAVACGALLMALANFPLFGVDQTIQESPVAGLLLKYVPFVLDLLPEEFQSLQDLLP